MRVENEMQNAYLSLGGRRNATWRSAATRAERTSTSATSVSASKLNSERLVGRIRSRREDRLSLSRERERERERERARNARARAPRRAPKQLSRSRRETSKPNGQNKRPSRCSFGLLFFSFDVRSLEVSLSGARAFLLLLLLLRGLRYACCRRLACG